MKFLSTIVLAALMLPGLIDNIATINRLKREAETAFKAKEYTKAIENYTILLDSLEVQDENIRTNLAHAYLMSGDTTAAQQNYTQLVKSDDQQVKSLAYQQLGIVNADQKKYKEALSFFKESLKADPGNEEARYNYELVKKLLKEQEENQQQNQDQQQQNQENKDQQEQNQDQQQQQDQQNQQGEDQKQQEQQGEESQQDDQQQKQGEQDKQESGEPKDQQQKEGQEPQEGDKKEDEQSTPSISDNLKEMNISEEKAKMILDAMRNSEMQYIQQNRRRVTQPRDKSKPDW